MKAVNALNPAPLAPDQSDLIKIARVFCIVFMMTTHVWPGLANVLAAQTNPAAHGFFVVMDVLGRSSVPLLSLISGVLFFSSFAARGPQSVIRSKFLTLIVPMVAWSAPMVVIAFAQDWLFGRSEDIPHSTIAWLNAFFAITREPANGSLHFLRDIFIMAIYGSAILTIYRFNRAAALIAGICVALVEQFLHGGLLFRNQIATFYLAGLLIAERGCFGWRPPWLLVGFGLMGLIAARQLDLLYAHDDILTRRISDHVPRVAATLLAWRLCSEIAARSHRLKAAMLALEPHIFTVFCSHQITVKFVAAAALVLGLSAGDAAYPALFIAQLALCIGVGVALSLLLKPFPLLRGKRGQAGRRRAPGAGQPSSSATTLRK